MANFFSWYSITAKECAVLRAFIKEYMPDLVMSAKAYDVEMAAALAHGMLISGFPVKDFGTCQTTIIKIIKTLVEVRDDGSIRKRRSTQHIVRAGSGQPVVEPNEDEAAKVAKVAKVLHEKLTLRNQKSKRTGKAEQGPRKRRRCKSSH